MADEDTIILTPEEKEKILSENAEDQDTESNEDQED